MGKRITLNVYNNQDTIQQLTFSQCADLTQPFSGDYVNVVKFSIPNSAIPILVWDPTITYTIRLESDGYFCEENMVLINRGSGVNIYEIDQLVEMINQTFINAVNGLNVLVPLPTTTPPYVVYNPETSLFSLILPTSAYGSARPYNPAISIFFNENMGNILLSIPILSDLTVGNNPNRAYQVLCIPKVETTYLTSYTKITQECLSLANFATPRTLMITTSLPIVSEAILGTINSQQNLFNILQIATFNYENGFVSYNSNNDFTTVTNYYRATKMTNAPLYTIKIEVFYSDSRGNIYPFYLPAHKSAFVTLDLFNKGDIL
jgi:hypothetical protein